MRFLITFLLLILFINTNSQNCGNYKDYIPKDTSIYPIKYIKVHLWVIQDSSNIYTNFYNVDTARKVLFDLINTANYSLSNNKKLWVKWKHLKEGKDYIKDTLFLQDTRIRYLVTPYPDSSMDPDRDGIIFVNDPSECYYASASVPVGGGKRKQIKYPKTARLGHYSSFAKKYGSPDAINIFIRAAHPVTIDTLRKINGRVPTWGWSSYYANYVTVIGIYQALMRHDTKGKFENINEDCLKQNNNDTTKCIFYGWHYDKIRFEYANLINHEIFHLLGLRHINFPDALDGTDCKETPRVPTVNGNTNNIMDYIHQTNYTSCQIGIVHKNILCIPNLFRKLHKNFCQYDSSQVIIISKDTKFNDIKYLNRTIVIENNASLTINNQLFLPIEAEIIIKPKASLTITKNGKIKVACSDEEWNNFKIEYSRKCFKKKTGKIFRGN